MTKFPLWKNIVIIFGVLIGIVYTIPNFYGETPAVQISTNSTAAAVGIDTFDKIKNSLQINNINVIGTIYQDNTLKIKFKDTDNQIKARDIIQSTLGDNYIVALNLLSATPTWLTRLNALPMFLGLDLRGGVHFLLSIDTNAAIKKTLNQYTIDIKRELRNNNIRYGVININNNSLDIQFRNNDNNQNLQVAYTQIQKKFPTTLITTNNITSNLTLTIPDNELKKIKDMAVSQNILILHNRVNELGVTEPIIQKQGTDRIVVELPGVQDTARAKDIIGRTATLEVHLVNENVENVNELSQSSVPYGYELLDNAGHGKILIKQDVELTGDNIINAQPGFDENGNPSVNIRLDSVGSDIFRDLTRANVGKRIAMVLTTKNKSEVVTAPVVRTEIAGGQVMISGSMNVNEANDIALLLRSGSLAAPMNIIEERTIGPSLGRDNIDKGFNSVLWGFILITGFMMVYYRVFGVIAVVSLSVNLLLLISVLSMLQATLTLPGIAAIALTLGMAIDANVLINERIREELQKTNQIHLAIENGYKHAFATILDSNITTLIAGLALLAFGTGPIKGFAVVHCLGILTSMFSAVLVSRGIVAVLYTNRRIKKLYI